MDCFQNKKSAVSGFLVMVLIITAGFVIIFIVVPLIVGGADTEASDSICRGSVALKARTYTEVDAPVIPVKLFDVSTPLLCKTSHLKLPEDRNADKEDVKKLFADLMASCWNRYGEGLIKDVFKEGTKGQKCHVCYTVDLRQTSGFRMENAISPRNFLHYLYTTPYKVTSQDDGCKVDGGFCIKGKSIEDCGKAGVFPDEDIVPSDMIIDEASSVCRKKGHTSCCYTDYGCLNRGGICISDPPEEIEEQYTRYNDDVWGCPTDEYCFVKNENHYTYGGYVQSFGGEGLTMVTTGIYPGETYAISFGSPSDTCGWCNLAKKIGAGIGAASVIAGGAILVATGVVASPFTLGASLGLTVVGTAVVAGGVAGATAGFVATALATNAIHHFQELFTTRNMNTVYFTTLKQLQQDGGLCSIIESV